MKALLLALIALFTFAHPSHAGNYCSYDESTSPSETDLLLLQGEECLSGTTKNLNLGTLKEFVLDGLSINSLSGFNVNSPSTGQALVYNGSEWVNQILSLTISNGDKGDITTSSAGATWTIDNDTVTYAKVQNVSATDRLLGRASSGAGDIEEIVITDFIQGLLDDTDAATLRTSAGLAIGSNVQAWDADLDTLAGGASATATFSVLNLTAATKQIVLDSDGTFTGTITLPAISGNRTYTLPASSGTLITPGISVTMQNKTNDNTNTFTPKDTLFTLQDDGDATKTANFDLSSISAATNRTYTLPNLSGNVALTTSNISGNAATATALASNPSNCSAGSSPLGVDASGAVESCTDYEEDLSNSAGLAAALSDESGTGVVAFTTSPVFTTPNIGSATGSVSGNAGTATALASNGSNCSAGSAPLGIDASGAAETCTDYEEDLSNSAGLLAALSDETGTSLAVFSNSPVFTDDFDLAAAGVRLGGSDGILTMLGLGNGNDEALSIDLDNGSANVVGISSSTGVTDLDLGTIDLNTDTLDLTGTGTLNGLDSIDGTGEATLEAALDIGGEVTSTGMGSTVISCTDCLGVSEIDDLYLFNDGDTATGLFDFGGADLEIPNGTSLPGTCTVGQLFMDTDATTGQRLYACQAINTWNLQGDGDSGGGGGVSDGDKGDITVSGTGSIYTIDNDVVTYAKMQNISATDRLLGRDTAAAGDTEELTVGGGLEFTGSGGIQRSALTGDCTASAGSNTTALGSGVIVNADVNASAAIDASKIGGGGVSTTEYNYMANLTADVQTQLNNKYTEYCVALSDQSTDLTTGTAKATMFLPAAATLNAVRAYTNTAPTGSTIIVDINEAGSTLMSATKLSIDASEKTSGTAASAAVISDSSIAANAEITFDIDQVGSTIKGKGLVACLRVTF